jgi:hypothetical protein
MLLLNLCFRGYDDRRILNRLHIEATMKAGNRFLIALLILSQFVIALRADSKAEISCGQTITENTILGEDLVCPPGTNYAIEIGASNVTLDLGGHLLSGYAPGTGVLTVGHEGITIRNGAIEGFNDGIFIINSRNVTVDHLTIRNQNVMDPNHFIFGVHIDGSQDVVVRDSLFEFPSVAHKEAVEIFDSVVEVSDIEVRGGGAGVSFSFAEVCDPVNGPSNGTVINSRFSEIYGAGIWIACSSNAWIQGNNFSTAPGVGIGIQGDAPFSGAVTGLTVKENFIHDTMIGIEFRGITESSISNNYVLDNQIWGIAMRQSLGCLAPEPGWECFNSAENAIADNETWGSGTDLYNYKDSLGNTWEGNTCETKQGADIPECIPPNATLTINYAGGRPGSYFTLEGANFPIDSTATITVNGSTLGTVRTDASGDLVFLLNTEQADEGKYIATATINPSSSARFVLDSSHLLHQQEGEGTVFNVPGGLTTHSVYVPLILR